jgi:predicted metal-dependent HD superfamily phosphohydrolase
MQSLWKYWQGLFENAAPKGLFEDLQKKYTQKGRFYHNWTHLEAMFEHWEQHQTSLVTPQWVAWAIFYHDVVYRATRKDNEARSAEAAVLAMRQCGCSEQEADLVGQWILATKTHELPAAAAADLGYLLDFDLAILGQPWPTYMAYAQNVRREYAIYPDFLYKPGRQKAMSKFLERAYIFQTPFFRSHWEQQARENIQREIEDLT